MASRNADSMTNAQGEFHPSKPRDEPLQTSGHQVGQMVGNDAAPEFNAQVLPAGSAPASKTFQPNPESETPGQADNELAGRSHGKENTSTSAQDTLVGATSGDVHTGLGHPGSGQTASEQDNSGTTGAAGSGAAGGSGMTDEMNAEAKALLTDHKSGPKAGQEHNTSLTGAEGKE